MFSGRRVVLRGSLLGLLLLAACGPDARVRIARLEGAQAQPPTDSPATGTAFGSLHAYRRLEIEGAFGNLRAPLLRDTPISVRDVSAGTPGSVVRVLEVDAPDGRSGAFHGHLDLTEAQLGAYLSGDWVVVIATEAHPDGEIRGAFSP
ncbi:MAG TPA: CHRD domain-containing protein [Myxococcaceae bacterium]|nr:CHRD domain-containing protein [Myxococcaceae bacterium]